ncbi:MAG: DUF2007 domain-containing protein [Candidatus Dormibacteraeota bacterium]|nr:DUF2007 domain-containing protein [Candidatus Dormibacteraeota bacterium]
MSRVRPDGPAWVEVYHGPCVRADVLLAVLEANGFTALNRRTSPDGLFSGLAFEQCLIMVPEADAEPARSLVASADADSAGDPD